MRHDEMTEFLDRVPDDCVVVVDEAYREYVRDASVPDGLALAAGRPNVTVLRTFSKAYGLAGLRVGYLVADPAVADQVVKTRLPYSVTHLAEVAVRASIRAESELFARIEETVKERERVRAALLDTGWWVPQSETNHLWLPLADEAAGFAAACAKDGVNVRACPGEGVRVSIGGPAANDVFLATAEAYRREVSR
jgi:histidinol-phosphate aminotransferase